ncbi:MAG TPA: FHA domain-containing protein [Fimbriimonadaceae bacterium]|nr:FHA domain-containing protein [Fimbriimonadaceae bacterium]
MTDEPLTQPVEDELISEAEPGEPEEASVADAGPRPRLIVKRNGAETDEEFPLNPPATVGRFDPGVGPIDVDLAALAEGTYVSRRHAKITCEDDVWRIQDLGSSNGTFLLRGDDFERVEEAELQDGDEIALGNARFVFRLS